MLSKNTDQAMARLALVSGTINTQSCNCPSDETLSAYIDGILSAEMRRQITAQLNSCSHCRERWLEVCQVTLSISEATAESSVDSYDHTKSDARDNIHRVATSIRKHIRWWAALPVTAVACAVLMLALILPSTLSLDKQLDGWSAQLNQWHMSEPSQTQPMPLPWENTSFSFNPSRPGMAQKALGAGLWQSQVELAVGNRQSLESPFPATDLIGQCCWEESRWQHHYQLGRWLGLLWWQTALMENHDTTAHSIAAGIAWSQHHDMLTSLRKKLSAYPGTEKSDLESSDYHNERIFVELDNLAPQLINPVDISKLKSHILATIHRLGPTVND